MLEPDNITIPMIEEQLDFIGSLIVKKPEKYECLLPIYERLEKEIDARRARNDRFASIKARINRIKNSNEKQTHISV